MASIENRSRYQVSVKNRDDLTKTFAHSSRNKAEAYCKALQAKKLKPKLSRLNDSYIIRIRQRGLDEQVLYANSLKEGELVKAKLKVEHSSLSTVAADTSWQRSLTYWVKCSGRRAANGLRMNLVAEHADARARRMRKRRLLPSWTT